MTNAAFKLEDSGFSREQVDALSEFMDGSVATKADIAELSGEIKAQGERLDGKITAEIAELSGEIKEVRSELSGEIKEVRSELSGKIAAEIAGLNGRINLIYWMLGVSVAGIVSLVIKAFTAS